MDGGLQGKGDAGVAVTTPPATVTIRPARDRARSCSWEAITTVAPRDDGVANQAVEKVPVFGVEAGVGLVEQPELGVAGHQGGQRHPAALTGGQGADRRGGQPARQTQPVEGRPDRLRPAAPAARTAKRTLSAARQIVVEGGGVTEQPDPPSHGSRIGHQVCAEHHGLAG